MRRGVITQTMRHENDLALTQSQTGLPFRTKNWGFP